MLSSIGFTTTQSQVTNFKTSTPNPWKIIVPSNGINVHLTSSTTNQLSIDSTKKVILWQQQTDQFSSLPTLNVERLKVKLDLVREIRKHIEFIETIRNEVSHFLEVNNHLIPLIQASIPIIEDFFPESRLKAELFSDPESDSQDIVIYIETSLSVDETSKRLEEFDVKWGNQIYLKSGRKILTMEEFE